MKTNGIKRSISVFLAFVMMISALSSAFYAYADGIIGFYEIDICYQDGTLVPDKDENGNDYVESLMESEKLQLTYDLVGGSVPDGGTVYWFSGTPTLVDVDQNGLVTAYDSSKGAVVQLWIDNEVKTIPVIGGAMGAMLESALFNDTINVDTMDTEQIVAIVDNLFGEDSAYGAYTQGFAESLKEYLRNINCEIHAQLLDENGSVLAEDVMKIVVTNSDKWYANFLPNGTHITNKAEIETTVSVGSTVKLEALTTPKRLNYGVSYSVESTSIFSQGKDIAEVDETGLVTFKSTGTVTIVASPRSEDVTKGLREFMKTANALIANGNIDTETLADILINYFGVNMNKTVLVALLNAYIKAAQYADENSESADAAAEYLASVADGIMKYVYNDKITFTVIEPQPLEAFEIGGLTTVQEGAEIQLYPTDIYPTTGDTSDITWVSSDPSIAFVDEKTGTVIGRDAGGSLGSYSSQSCQITATSAANDVSRTVTVTVKGKTGSYLSDAEIIGPSFASVGEEVEFAYAVYPQRHSSSRYLKISWGIITGTDEETGEPVYSWADAEGDVSDGIGLITNDGIYTAIKGGLCTVALKAVTSYTIGSSVYEISSVIKTQDIQNDIPVQSISLSAENAGSWGTLTSTETTVNGSVYLFSTVKLNSITPYYGRGAKVTATIEPATSSNTDIVWRCSNESDFYTENQTSNSIEVRARASVQTAVSTQVWCETADGRVKSEIMTLTVTRNYATGNVIDGGNISAEVDKTVSVTHTETYDGSSTSNMNANHDAVWFSSDESIFTVSALTDKTGNAVITGVDVGTATVYCASADGGIIDSRTVTVYPNKDYLENVIELCDKTVILRTEENKALYADYMQKLDKAYFVLYDEPMAAQSVCDTAANILLAAFEELGGYIGIGSVEILDKDDNELAKSHITVNVGTFGNYTKNSYDLNYAVIPADSMYSHVEWSSNSSSISVDKHGVCTPTENSACSALITCTVRDYLGNSRSDSVYVVFAKTPATGISLNKSSIDGGEIGESEKLTATVLPSSTFSNANIKDVIWHSSNSSVASVSSDGTVSFLRGGHCVITAKSVDGGFTADCSVTVITNFNALSSLVNTYESMGLQETDYYPDTYAVYISAINDAKQMIADGTADQDEADEMYSRLEAAYNALKKYVYPEKIEIYLDGEAASDYYQSDLSWYTIYSYAELDLKARIYPVNGSYESVRWESSTSFIKVSDSGVCKPAENKSGYGKVTCTVTDHFGNEYSDFVWVSFTKTPVTGVTVSESVISGKCGESYQLSATVQPEGGLFGIGKADIQDVMWSSDNESVATVDQNGVVTFVYAGLAHITATSYDGGFSATCVATTLADRTALSAALEQYADIEYSDYEYEYGILFKNAYTVAERAMTDLSFTQEQIDEATSNLLEAASDLISHPFVKIEEINLFYTASDLTSQKASGTVGSNDSIQLIASDIARYASSITVTVTPSVSPENAMYTGVSWQTLSSSNINITNNSDGSVSVKPTLAANSNDAYCVLNAVYTDAYGRTYTRQLSIAIGKAYVTGIAFETTDYSAKATDAPVQINYSISSSNGNPSSPANKQIEWTTSDAGVASVDANGVVTPVDEGSAVITARTVDGGYTASLTVNVTVDYDALIDAVNEYSQLVSVSRGQYVYTESSLDALEAAIIDAQPVAEAQTAKQAVVNEKLNAINAAYAALELYVPAEGLTLDLVSNEDAAVINDGYIRYTGTALNGKSVQLSVNTVPAGSYYEQIEWSSDNSAITVESDGTVKSTNATAKVGKITCTITNYDDSSYTAEVYVSFVRHGVTGIGFNSEDTYFGYNGDTAQLQPDITYSGLTSVSSYYVSDCKYSSSDESIATVDNNGVVTFVSYGTATITATTLDGGYTATVNVYTTNDTRALRETIATAKAFTYTDYAYDYGMAFKEKYDAALQVYNNPVATQDAIDTANQELESAIEALDGHPFIALNPQLIANGISLNDNHSVQTDDNAQITISAEFADGAVVKSYSLSAGNLQNATAAQNEDGSITLTRTEETASATLTILTEDEYSRQEAYSINLILVEKFVPCTGLILTANSQEIGSSYTYSCGGNYSNCDLRIGFIPVPENSNIIESVSYSSSNSSTIKIDSETGEVTVSGIWTWISSHDTTITCTVTNTDGSTASQTVSLTVKKN